MIPVAGSAYAYSYATMGEFIAWIIGWDLILEYAFGAVTVSTSWSGYFLSLMHKTLGIPVSDTMLRFTKGPVGAGRAQRRRHARHSGSGTFPASFIGLVVAAILYRGMRESAFVNNLIVVIKVTIVLVFIGLGISLISTDNLFVNHAATGIFALVPAKEMITLNGNQVNAYGWGLNGVLTGAGVVFFAYIGFDAVSTTAQEAKNPEARPADRHPGVARHLHDPLHPGRPHADRRRELQGTGRAGSRSRSASTGSSRCAAGRPVAQTVFTFFIKLGALAGLTSVILVMMMGQTRIFYAMSKDGLLPWFGAVHKEHGTPVHRHDADRAASWRSAAA